MQQQQSMLLGLQATGSSLQAAVTEVQRRATVGADRVRRGLDERQHRVVGRLEHDRRRGRDAYVWPTDDPPVSALMARAVDRVAARAGAAERPQVEGVARRLLGEYHLPAVQEALGCLIPRALDPELDGKKPKGQAAAGAGPGGVALAAGHGQLNISLEGDLYRPVALSKGPVSYTHLTLPTTPYV